jgi:hypothetical protein
MKFGELQLGLRAISHKHVLLCEGMHDAEFFKHLTLDRGLPAFQVASCGFVAGAPSGRDGVDNLTSALNAIVAVPGFSQVEAVLIVADNDSDPIAAFKKVQQLIGATADIAAGRRYAIPDAPLTKSGIRPVMVVMMLPWTGVPGALDTLCLTAASNKEPAKAVCVDTFAKCAQSDKWPPTKMHKMKLRSLLSATNESDPYISPDWVWRDGTDLVPLSDNVFDQIATFIRGFPAMVP